MKSLQEKLNNYTVDENGCWIWQGHLNQGGYGVFHHKGWSTSAHRAYYKTYIDPDLPDNLDLDHFYCKNRRCINPKHLEPVTPMENLIRSGSSVSRVIVTGICKRGHKLEGENVYPYRGCRVCRECRRIRDIQDSVTSTCLYCKQPYQVNKYMAARRKFCSLTCSSNHKWHGAAVPWEETTLS